MRFDRTDRKMGCSFQLTEKKSIEHTEIMPNK